MKLPTKHIPSSIRTPKVPMRTQTTYACGYENKPGVFKMWLSPLQDAWAMLEAVPKRGNDHPVIIEYQRNGYDRVIYRWNTNGYWIRVNELILSLRDK